MASQYDPQEVRTKEATQTAHAEQPKLTSESYHLALAAKLRKPTLAEAQKHAFICLQARYG